MNRKWFGKFVPLTIIYTSLCLLFLVFAQPGWAAPLAQNTQNGDDGQEYIVRPGDSLSTISTRFYGQPNAYSAIVEATNAKAESDARFTRITNPSRIQVGQRLWLPNSADLPFVAQEALTQTTAMSARIAASPVTATLGLDPEGSVRFVTPGNGETVPPTFTVVMSATGMTVEPAGAINANAGHFHILVDTDFVEPGEVIINDAQHLHYGKGQYTATLNLDPGEHVLRLQFANGAHIALDGAAYQDTITVTVAGDTAEPSVAFVTPLNDATVPPTFTVAMTATGLTVEPAGAINENAGHFHILVDTDFVEAGAVIINDDQHLHYGKGQYTTTLNLEPGVHVLRLQFANGAHIALDGPAYQDTITVTVAETMTSEQRVRFVTPLNGATVPPTFTVDMGATGLLVEPAGEIKEGAGHFHILVNTDFVPAGDVIINDEQHRHYGKGQYTTTLNLEPGVHVLRLQFADGAHIALDGAAYQDTITVTVSADAAEPPQSNAAPSVRFVTPLDGATVPAKFAVEMTATGLTVEPAGEIKAGAGHFHILVNTDFVEPGEVIINDAQHLHYGKGQYTTTLELPPGEHILRLQFANGAHIALDGAAYRDEITVTVK
jgi:hypothetical protein